jgi:DNA ligase (NAD+)
VTSEEMLEKVESARRQYYETGESDLTDDEYDALRDELLARGIHTSTFQPTAVANWSIVKHKRPMLGMPLCPKSRDEFAKMIDAVGDTGDISLKYDGMALELQYSGGYLTAAVLRGDGDAGEDIIHNATTLHGVPKLIPLGEEFASQDGIDLAVYGEVVISFNNLIELNRLRAIDGLKPYANPRNAVAMIRSRSASKHHLGLFTFRPYDVYPRPFSNQAENMDWLARLTQDAPNKRFNAVTVDNLSWADAWRRLERATEVKQNKLFAYQLDGIVYRGSKGHSVKLKFPAEAAITTVTSIVERVGRTGVIAPVVLFEPVSLGGVTITRASAHNSTLIAERLSGIGVGAKILVSRRGDVIPHVEMVITAAEVQWAPTGPCPSCGAPIEQDGSVRRCSADPSDCPSTTLGLLLKFTREVGIDGVGPGVMSGIVGSRLAETPAELFILTEEHLAAAVLPDGRKLGETTASKIVASIFKASHMTWGTLLSSVGIRGCARSVMEAVAAEFPDAESLQSATVSELSKIHGVGIERAEAIRTFIDTRWTIVEDLLTVVRLKKENKGGALAGMVICITLGLNSGSRPEVEAKIKAHGGIVKSSVTKQVTHLVCNYPNESTEKLQKARELGITIIDESVLLSLMPPSAMEDDDVIDQSMEF